MFQERMAENFPKLMININLQIQEAYQTLLRKNIRKAAPWHILVKLLKKRSIRENLKSSRRIKNALYSGNNK